MYSCPKQAVTSSIGRAPLIGNTTMGNRAVIEIGNTSVIHQMAIHKVVAKTTLAVSLKPAGLKKKYVAKKTKGPSRMPNDLMLMVARMFYFMCNAFLLFLQSSKGGLQYATFYYFYSR